MSADRYCCDGICNENQGRGGCPARPNLDAGEPLSQEGSNFFTKVTVTAFIALIGIISGGAWLLLKVGCGA